MNEAQIIEDLKRHEGFRSKPYVCTQGKWTIGYGYNLDAGMAEEEAAWLLERRMRNVFINLRKKIEDFGSWPPQVQRALVNMGYQMGVEGVLKFKNMLLYLDNRDYKKASEAALNSAWARQTPKRAKEVAGWIASV